MIELLKKLFEQRHKRLTVMLLDDSKPDKDNSYKLRPNSLFVGITFLGIMVILVTAGIFMITPLGNLINGGSDSDIRSQVLEITNKAIALEDSLLKRDRQLQEMKEIIRLNVDTTLTPDQRFDQLFSGGEGLSNPDFVNFDQTATFERLSQNEILFSNIVNSAPEFPAKFPVQGTLTRRYEPEQEHFGLDIATQTNELVINIADGVIVNSNWTMNNGYTISVQHSGGILAIYKHLSKINKRDGDLVLKGDILGEAGNIGVLSTGLHLHFEIWKDGTPQNPEFYLIK
ncbi:M23 family metallopeptidase [Gracilimonas sp.]|uniref:M23 family metallopeptidase n=1 Tax=Gracilimonas sp. TaxID=1974203 RepID=UPI002871CCC7|nr:M23 family metallopeptidase [Gracilimonas sp.]